MDIGIQAGLFGIMDIGRSPTALINADYYVAIPITYQYKNFSGLVRIYHLSAHLGDEFMLTEEGKKINRVNLSYEGVDFLGSFKFDEFRLYGGGGYIIHKDPSYIKPKKIQLGVEYKSDTTFWNDRLRPVWGVDIKLQELQDWYPGVSCKVGWQLENSFKFNSSKVLVMLEYFRGKSIHGQLYNNNTEYVGVGVHAFL